MNRAGWLLLLGLAASSCKQKNAGHEKSTVDTLTVQSPASPQKQVDQTIVGIMERTTLIEPEDKDKVCWENWPAYYPVGSQDVMEAMSLRPLTQGKSPQKCFSSTAST